MKILFLLLLPVLAHAEIWVARGQGANVYLKAEKDLITFKGHLAESKIILKDCNREQAEEFMETLRSKLAQPMSYTTALGINLQIDGNSTPNVSHKSALGIDLLSMDDKFLRFKLAQEALCSSSR
jgi:hypothetical protein